MIAEYIRISMGLGELAWIIAGSLIAGFFTGYATRRYDSKR